MPRKLVRRIVEEEWVEDVAETDQGLGDAAESDQESGGADGAADDDDDDDDDGTA